MTRILVVYGTTDGHTAKVAAAIADTLRVTWRGRGCAPGRPNALSSRRL